MYLLYYVTSVKLSRPTHDSAGPSGPRASLLFPVRGPFPTAEPAAGSLDGRQTEATFQRVCKNKNKRTQTSRFQAGSFHNPFSDEVLM